MFSRGDKYASLLHSPGFTGSMSSLLLCLLAMIIVSSCGSTEIVPTVLYATRSSPLRPLPPVNITITDKQAVQKLYQAAYQLPQVSGGTRNCLDDDGIVYHLTFSQDATTNDSMDVEASGCLVLTTSQGPLQENYAFLSLVEQTIHISPLVPLIKP